MDTATDLADTSERVDSVESNASSITSFPSPRSRPRHNGRGRRGSLEQSVPTAEQIGEMPEQQFDELMNRYLVPDGDRLSSTGSLTTPTIRKIILHQPNDWSSNSSGGTGSPSLSTSSPNEDMQFPFPVTGSTNGSQEANINANSDDQTIVDSQETQDSQSFSESQ